MDITEPLVLSRGSHQPGSGRGCAMNVIAWELGGAITDYPPGVHPVLARVVQMANDSLAVPTLPQPKHRKVVLRRLVPVNQIWGLDVADDPVTMTEKTVWEPDAADVAAYESSFEVPAQYGARLLDIAHETLDTIDPSLCYRPTPGGFFSAGSAELGSFDRFHGARLAAIFDRAEYSERLLYELERGVGVFRMVLGLPRRRPAAPSVAAVNDALRKMRQVVPS